MQQTQQTGSFDKLGLDPSLLKAVDRIGYSSPTEVQAAAIPAILKNRDVIVSAKTGSGKTAAFVLPILQRIIQKPSARTRALILAPTRELASQTEKALRDLSRGTGVRTWAVYGGVSMMAQERALRGRVEVVVATPGRLLDHMNRGNVDFEGLEVLVLDEADRMLDMGFLPDVQQIVDSLPKNRQTLLFSATIPREVENLARNIMKNPTRIIVGEEDRPPETIRHTVYPVPHHLKSLLLAELIKRERMKSVLVFTRTKRRADILSRELADLAFPVGYMHGGRTQAQREAALAGFRAGRQRVLVATDVAARGLDVQGITHIVNYDLPATPTDYIHRVGRTARLEASGEAMTLVSPGEDRILRDIEYDIGLRFEQRRLEGFDYHAHPTGRSQGYVSERGFARDRQPWRGGGRAAGGRPGGYGKGSGGRYESRDNRPREHSDFEQAFPRPETGKKRFPPKRRDKRSAEWRFRGAGSRS